MEVAGAGPQRAAGRGSCRVGVLLSADPLAESLSPSATTVGAELHDVDQKKGDRLRSQSNAALALGGAAAGLCQWVVYRLSGPRSTPVACQFREAPVVEFVLLRGQSAATHLANGRSDKVYRKAARVEGVPSPLVRPVGRMSTTPARGPCLRGAPPSELMSSLS